MLFMIKYCKDKDICDHNVYFGRDKERVEEWEGKIN